MVFAPDPNRRYTYKDYLEWPDEERWELIGGIPFNMTPAPTPDHQRILRELLTEFNYYLRGKTCEVYPAPFDVRLFPNEKQDDDTVVQPDLVIICDSSKINKKGCDGSPDLIVEIISPSTAKKDRFEKFNLYQRAGVKEYWMVQPVEQVIEVYKLNEQGKYGEREVYSKGDHIRVGIFQDLDIDLSHVFR
ncbi:Uma2 family endonuclease [Ammoniphilus sp. YIM 78166]|uniref:Uma2 family endonuclease n=1 Tax=Ammoniphilus sp. YIM 78166 TaxID=1644106 RepID=UPI00106F5380|nr:Uma2 family endonuclease [Ammoniphilus sp. YIM 78166]